MQTKQQQQQTNKQTNKQTNNQKSYKVSFIQETYQSSLFACFESHVTGHLIIQKVSIFHKLRPNLAVSCLLWGKFSFFFHPSRQALVLADSFAVVS